MPAVTNDSTVATVVTGALVSNIGQTASGSAASVSTSQSQGQGFTTGANSGGYTLGSVELDVSTFSGTASDITVSIYSESSDNPETLVHTLTTPASISLEVTTFTAPSGRDAGRQYDLLRRDHHYKQWNLFKQDEPRQPKTPGARVDGA